MTKPRSNVRVVPLRAPKNGMTHMVDIPARFANGKRRRLKFDSAFAAQHYVDQLKEDVEKLGRAIAAQSDELRHDAEVASTLLRPFGCSLTAAAESWIAHNARRQTAVTLGVFRDLVHARKESENLSRVYRDTYWSTIDNKLVPWLGENLNVAEITSSLLYEKLKPLKEGVGAKRFNNQRDAIHNFFSYGLQEPTVYFTSNPVSAIPRLTWKRTRARVLTPAQVARFMEIAWDHYPELVPYFAVCFWGGIRAKGEALRSNWAEMFLGDLEIIVCLGKQDNARMVDLPENAARWMAPFEQQQGPLLPCSYFIMNERRKIIAGLAGFDWPTNAARKCFASYTQRLNKSDKETAEQCGNSPDILCGFYIVPVKRNHAKEFFAIYPPARPPGQGGDTELSTCA